MFVLLCHGCLRFKSSKGACLPLSCPCCYATGACALRSNEFLYVIPSLLSLCLCPAHARAHSCFANVYVLQHLRSVTHTHTHNTGIHNTHTCVPCTCKCCTHLPPVHTQPLLCMHSVQDMHVIKVEGGPPSARSAHAAVVVHDRYIVMFGGVQLFA